MSGYETAQLSELEEIQVGDTTLVWRPVRRRFDVRAFGVNAYTAAEAGDEVVEQHTESANEHEELYVVLAGHATFTVGEEEVDAPTGTLIFIRDPALRRHAVARESNTSVLAVGGRAGAAYEVSAWEYWFAANPAYKAGDYDAAVELMLAGLSERPDHPALLYNLACYEALAGRLDDAQAHLSRAFELDPKTREWAKDDEDLAGLKKDGTLPF